MATGDNKVGILFHRQCLHHRCLFDENHIEAPERLGRILKTLEERGFMKRCRVGVPEAVDDSILLRALSPGVLNDLKSCAREGSTNEDLELSSSSYEDVFICRETLESVRLSAGCAMGGLKQVMEEGMDSAFALCRPPGHHASLVGGPSGFCFVNNVALAAMMARETYGVSKILIVDWDVHAGNGTQDHFFNDPKILVVSVHRYQEGLFWPNLPESNWDYIGEGGRHINVCLNGTGFGDDDYDAIFGALVMPLAREFEPELVLVSCGFDSSIGDPEGEMRVSPAGFGRLTRCLSLLEKPLLFVLEGGYFLKALEESAASVVSSLLGEPVVPSSHELRVSRPVAQVILALIGALAPHWDSMNMAKKKLLAGNPSLIFPQKAEYRFQGYRGRDMPMPYPTRGQYDPRPVQVEEDFQAQLREMLKEAQMSSKVEGFTYPGPSQDPAIAAVLRAFHH